MTYAAELVDRVNAFVDTFIADVRVVSAKEIGMDPRSGDRLYIFEDAVGVDTRHARSLNYYGGFEYIDDDFVTVVGRLTIYSDEDERVREVLEAARKVKR